MRKLLIIIALFFYGFSHSSIAQEYQDLLILYVDEKFDKCFDKAVKYTEKDDSKKDALPYLYASMASFGMSQVNEYKDAYPKAYKTALSYATKYRKKDPENAYKEDSEGFIEKLKMIIAEEVENYILEDSDKGVSKAAGLLKKVAAFDLNCPGAQLLWGHFEVLNRNKTEGKKVVAEAFDRINAIGSDVQFGDMTDSQQFYLRMALIEYAKSQNEKDPVGAKKTISLGHQYFYEEREDCHIERNEIFKKVYDEITG